VLVPLLETVMQHRTTQAWQDLLLKVDVPCAPVLDYAQILAEPQTAARSLKVTVTDARGQPIDLVGTPFHIEGTTLPPARIPPALGQDTDAVLRELLQLTDTQLAELREQGVI
jgi:crotonobetainyl-CoA:carnitine CoA-transferase CaiB-like acyl-CoA transferase